MICRLSIALCTVLVLATPVAASAEPGQRLNHTDGTMTAFRDCFVASQEKARRPWGFVPDETGGGGSFSTIPGRDTYSPYTLTVREGALDSGISLTGEVPPESGPMIATAIDGCLAASRTRTVRAR
jgi:hypothetical protein